MKNLFQKRNVGSKGLRFSLIELLVTIAVIAILTGLLLPALNSARSAGRKIACVNQMKNLSLAIGAYTPDNEDYLPPQGLHKAFTRYLYPYLGIRVDRVSDAISTSRPGEYSVGLQCRTPRGLLFCPETALPNPAFPGAVPAEISWYYSNYSQSYATQANILSRPNRRGRVWLIDGNTEKIIKLQSGALLLGETNHSVVYGDGDCDTGTMYMHLIASYPAPDKSGAPAWNHHRNAANFLFLGGNVNTLRFGRHFNDDYLLFPR